MDEELASKLIADQEDLLRRTPAIERHKLLTAYAALVQAVALDRIANCVDAFTFEYTQELIAQAMADEVNSRP